MRSGTKKRLPKKREAKRYFQNDIWVLILLGMVVAGCGRNLNDYFKKSPPAPRKMPAVNYPPNSVKPVPYVVSTEHRFVQLPPSKKVDFIFSIDNSGSMDPFIAAVQTNLVAFVGGILKEGLDFQVGVIQNSWAYHNYPINLLSVRGPYGVVAGNDPQILFKAEENIKWVRYHDQNYNEMPLYSILHSPEVSANQQLFRSDSAKVFIVLSDTQEPALGNADYYYTEVQKRLGPQIKWRVITVGNPSENYCPGAEGYQPVLEELTKMTGGVMARVCDSDYAAILQKAVVSTISLLKDVDLSPRVPRYGTIIPSSIQVFIDGVQVPLSSTNGFTFDPLTKRISFFGSFVPQAGQNVEIYFDYEMP